MEMRYPSIIPCGWERILCFNFKRSGKELGVISPFEVGIRSRRGWVQRALILKQESVDIGGDHYTRMTTYHSTMMISITRFWIKENSTSCPGKQICPGKIILIKRSLLFQVLNGTA